jgi:hypothetical protein
MLRRHAAWANRTSRGTRWVAYTVAFVVPATLLWCAGEGSFHILNHKVQCNVATNRRWASIQQRACRKISSTHNGPVVVVVTIYLAHGGYVNSLTARLLNAADEFRRHGAGREAVQGAGRRADAGPAERSIRDKMKLLSFLNRAYGLAFCQQHGLTQGFPA